MKRLICVLAILALLAPLAAAQPSLTGSYGLFRTIAARNAGPVNYGLGAYVYGWKYDDESAADSSRTGEFSLAISPSGYFSASDLLEFSLGTGFLMPSRYIEQGGVKTTVNPTGLGDTRLGIKLSKKLSGIFAGGIYLGYDLATKADTFLYSGLIHNGGLEARLLGDFLMNEAGCLTLNAGVYYSLDKVKEPDMMTFALDDSVEKALDGGTAIPFGLGFSYDLGPVSPYAEFQGTYLLDEAEYPEVGSPTGTVKRGLLDNPTWAGAGLRACFNGLNLSLGGEYNLQPDNSSKSRAFDDQEHWHAVLGLHYAPRAKRGPKLPATAGISGKVTDARGRGLSGASVSAAGQKALSDSFGNYTLTGLVIARDSVEVRAEARLYINKTAKLRLTKKNRQAPAVQDFVLELSPIPPSEVNGKITDYKTGAPVAAALSFNGQKVFTAPADTNGNYAVKLPPGNYQAAVSAAGYNDNIFLLTVAEGQPITGKNLSLVKKREVFSFNNINFATGKSQVTPVIGTALQPLLKVLQDNPNLTVEISGHTDNRGSKARNMKLSQARAEAVVAWLITNNVKSAMTAKGYGSSQPVAENRTSAGRAQNRRIEINVIDQ